MSRYSGDGVSPLMQQLGASGGGGGWERINLCWHRPQVHQQQGPRKTPPAIGFSCERRGGAGNGLEKELQVRFSLAVGKAKA